MKKWKSFRYLVLLCAGGMIFSVMMGYPQRIRERVLPTLHHAKEENRIQQEFFADRALQEQFLENKRFEEATDEGEQKVIDTKNELESLPGQEEKDALHFGLATEHYFEDAVFIGDSRVVGLYEYGGLDEATFYCASGMSLAGVFGPPNRHFKDGNWKENIADSLQKEQFGKVYIMLGINDMGTGDLDYFTKQYENIIAQIREWQPEAVLFIQSIMSVTEKRSNQGDYINNEGIKARNTILKSMDNGTNVFYLDVNSAVCDEEGNLRAEYTSDGVHLYAKYIYLWTDYLKSHALVEY